MSLLIFDLDGTLIDSRQDLCTGVNLMRQHYGLAPLPLETVTGFVGDGIRILVSRSLAGVDGIDLDEAVRIDKRFYREHLLDETVLYPGVAEGLAALDRAGHRMAVLTNKPEEATLALLQHFDIQARFLKVIGGDSGYPLKPDPAAVRACMALAGASAAATWMIGDNHTDIEAAHRAGVNSAFVTYGFGRRGGAAPTLNADSFAELVVRMAPL